MQSMTKAPSLVRVVLTDFPSFMAACFPPVSWCLYGVLRIADPGGPGFFLYVALAATLIGAAVLVWRYRTMAAVFAHGTEVQAVISSIWFFRGRGRVEYVYTFLDRKFVGGNAIMKTNRTRALAQGDSVTIVIEATRPKRAFIRDLYL